MLFRLPLQILDPNREMRYKMPIQPHRILVSHQHGDADTVRSGRCKYFLFSKLLPKGLTDLSTSFRVDSREIAVQHFRGCVDIPRHSAGH